MKLHKIAAALLCAASLTAFSQTASVTGTKVLDGSGNLLTSGKWCLGATCFTVTNGLIAASSSVTAGTGTVTVTDTAGSTTYLTVPSVAVSIPSFNWNGFILGTGIAASGIGMPRIACSIGASYTQTDNSLAWNAVSNNGACIWTANGGGYAAPAGTYAGNGAPSFAATSPSVYVRSDASPTSSATYVTVAPAGTVTSNWVLQGGGGGGGGLTSFTTGNLSPLFTATLGENPTTAPALAFTLSSTSQNFFLAGPTSGSGAPAYRAIVAADIPALNYAAASEPIGAAAQTTANTAVTNAAAAQTTASAAATPASVTSAVAAERSLAANASNLTSGSVTPQLSAPVASAAVPSAEWPMDDGTGTTARDISGNGNTATLNGATWIPGAGIQCLPTVGATPQSIVTPLSSFGTIMIAFAPWNNGGNNTASPLTSSTGPSNADPAILGTTASSTGGIFLYSAQLGAMGMQLNVIRNSPSSGGAFLAPNGFGGLHILTYESATTDVAYVDGVAIPGANGSSSSQNAITSGTYQFCSVGTTAVNGYRGTIMYAKAWPAGTYLTAQQVQTESNRIAAIVNARPSIPKLSFDFTRTPHIIGVGDSIMAGVPGTGWLNSTFVTPTNAYTITNTGLFGVTGRDLNWNSAHWEQAIAPGGGKNYCLVNTGSNDIAHSLTPADVLSSNLQIGITAKKDGCIPVLMTTISRTGSLDTNISTLDTLERSNAVQSGVFAALVDVAELSVLSPNGTNNTNAACYQGDLIHLTGPGAGTCANSLTGYGNYAVGVTRIINTLDGSSDTSPDFITSNAFVETDANNVMIHTPTAAATNQLVDCTFITGRKKTITNQSTFAITVTTTASQTITGNATIAAGAKASFTAMVTSPTAGGCYWLQQ